MSIYQNLRCLFAAMAIFSFVGGATEALAQATATGTGTANATIAKPITITPTADLDFGIIVPNGTGNGSLTVAVDTAGTRTIAGDVDGALLGGTVGAAAFDITGRPNATYSITLPGAAATLTGASTGATMSVGSFLDSTGGAGGTLTDPGGTGLGSDSFTVGATLTVGETQADDTYSGTFDVTVAYN